MKRIKTTRFQFVLIILLVLATSWFVYDLLFSKPEVHEGVIVEMKFIPGEMQSGQYRMGSKVRPQMIVANEKDRWIATVRREDGTLVLVDCQKHHFDNKEVGGTLRFKEYTGGSLDIQYFAHNEED